MPRADEEPLLTFPGVLTPGLEAAVGQRLDRIAQVQGTTTGYWWRTRKVDLSPYHQVARESASPGPSSRSGSRHEAQRLAAEAAARVAVETRRERILSDAADAEDLVDGPGRGVFLSHPRKARRIPQRLRSGGRRH